MAASSFGSAFPHDPVLYQEIIYYLQPRQGGKYIDCTLGMGGHSQGILDASSPDGMVLGLDLDPEALLIARQRLAPYGSRFIQARASYTTIEEQMQEIGWQKVNGVLLDLGVSSLQFDTPERGFSFQMDGPLDMRFDPDNPKSAAELVNRLSEKELAELIYRNGEERKSRQIARAIVRARPIKTTRQLAELVSNVNRSARPGDRIHPATRTFQALRIAVNQELESLEKILPLAVSVLLPGGRLVVVSFHSLEDRIVKQFIRRESRDCLCPPKQPVCTCGHKASIRVITPRPIRPSKEEVMRNPRSRSALLRVAERLSDD